jgi:4'-phosphopantetheinyl transferase
MGNKFELFLCNDYKKYGVSEAQSEDLSAVLLKKAMLASHMTKNVNEDLIIYKSDKGKPYFKDSNIYFNISHSGSLWACLVGNSCCGLDIQYIRPCNFRKIAGRFFTKREQEYIEVYGIEGFYDIWTRREAYGKYTGEGFFCKYPEFVDSHGQLVNCTDVGLEPALEFREIIIKSDIKCVLCIEKNIDAEIIIMENF